MTEKENKEKYNEILRLRDMLEKAEIPFVWKEHKDYRNGYQILYPVDGAQNICSVIEHKFSYGNEKDLLEIQGLMTKEEKEKQLDTVLGFLTAENVFKRIEKHWKNRYEEQTMFEKETEEYVIKKHHIDKTKLPIDFSLRCEFSDDFTDFQKGAEFGYIKGNKQLTKAKGLIEELSSSLSVVGECDEEECELLNQAEQFLINIERYENGK